MGLRVEGKGIRVRMLVEDGSFCERNGEEGVSERFCS